MQSDGNLVTYSGSTPKFAVGTWGCCHYLSMQSDGNLVIYGPGNVAKWSTDTYGSGHFMKIGNDGMIRVYSSTCQVMWSSGVSSGMYNQPNPGDSISGWPAGR
jgi:hypothetical protein